MENILTALTDRIRDAAAHHTPLRIQGGGSKDFYGESLQGELLDTRAYSGITSYVPSELVVTARAGTSLAELEIALAEKANAWLLSRHVLRHPTARAAAPVAAWLRRP